MPDLPRLSRALVRAPLLACFALATALCLPAPAAATEGAPTPLEVRAVFLLNLARFVKWPDAPPAEPNRDRAFVIGCYADDPIAIPLRQIVQGESIGGRPIELRELRRATDFAGCNLVYLGDALSRSIVRAIERLRERPVLFVGNTDGLLEAGGHVQFYPRGSQVRLRVSPDNLRLSHLVPNSQLLRVATVR